MLGMAGHALQPRLHGRIRRQVKATLMGHMGVGIQCDIGNRILLAHQVRRGLQLTLHYLQRLVTALMRGFVLFKAILRHVQVELDKPRHGDIRFVAVLLEELPLQHLSAQARLGRQKLAAIGQEVEDRVGFPQARAIFQFQHRDLAVRVLGQEFGGLGVTVEDVDIDPLVWNAQ
ncbi:hypothetical protein AZH11_04480 [Pseudomonas simiae]|nr:hypothetical protein AZH11_04480 [Pseudomonas simiae]